MRSNRRVERATGKPRFDRKRERWRLSRGARLYTAVGVRSVGTRECDKQAAKHYDSDISKFASVHNNSVNFVRNGLEHGRTVVSITRRKTEAEPR